MLITSLTTTTRGLLNISALHVQYGIQAFGKFKRPEYTRLHLRKLQSRSPQMRSIAPILHSVYYISIGHLYHKILRQPLDLRH